MNSLVLELQRESMDPHMLVSDLLRKAIVVASKLGIEELKKWSENELRGYGKEPVPSYRNVRGELKAHNPYRGLIPVILEDSKLMEKLRHRDIGQPISGLEDLYYRKGESRLQVPLPHDALMRFFGNSEEFRLGIIPTLIVGKEQIFGILESVRNEILNWSLELERRGILGDGMTFSQEDIRKAGSITFNISNFSGVLGDVTSSNFQIGNYNTIHEQLKKLGVSQSERNELEDILDNIKSSDTENRKSLIKRGTEWLSRNGTIIGALSETIRGWFETLK